MFQKVSGIVQCLGIYTLTNISVNVTILVIMLLLILKEIFAYTKAGKGPAKRIHRR